MTAQIKLDSKIRHRLLRDALSNIPLMVGVLVITVIVIVVLFGPLFAPYNPYLVDRIVVDHYEPETKTYIRVPLTPSEDFLLGTNEIGQDMLSVLLHGARNTLVAVVLIATARVLLGLSIGLITGWFADKWFDRFIQALIGIITTLPMLVIGLIAIFLIGMERGMIAFFIGLVIVGWTEVAQYIRGEVLVARRMPYMEAARSVGLREIDIAVRHVIPNILPQIFVIAFLEMGAVMMLLGELALLGIFIGGAARFDFSDILGPTNDRFAPNRPEWGAMIAGGYSWLRSFPHIVFIPSAVVFVAVLGFNALGEGLRGLFEQRAIKTSFILSRRMLLVLASVFAITLLIFQGTQPSRWFAEMAGNFKAENVLVDAEIIPQFAAQTTGWGRPVPIAEYVAVELDNYGTRGGLLWSKYFDVRRFYVYEPARMPTLDLLDENGDAQIAFKHGRDFGYVVDEYGGPGLVEQPLVLVHFFPDLPLNADELASKVAVENRIVLLEEGNSPLGIAQVLVDKGAAGIIWVAEPGVAIQDARSNAIPEKGEYDEELGVPVFRVRHWVAEHLLATESLSLATLSENATEEGDAPSYQMVNTNIVVRMQLELKSKKPLQVNNVVAYLQGTDAIRGRETILFVLPCDGLWRSTVDLEEPPAYQPRQCSAALIIEFMRLLNDHVIDPKRPIMVILWGGGEFSYLGLSEWLSDVDNFAHLAGPGLRLQARPAILIQIADDPNSSEFMMNDRSLEGDLEELFQQSMSWVGLEMAKGKNYAGIPMWISNQQIGVQASFSVDFDNPDLQAFGEGFSMAMIRMLREPILISNPFR